LPLFSKRGEDKENFGINFGKKFGINFGIKWKRLDRKREQISILYGIARKKKW